jgi:transcriptional regulator with XRE-family HTH domain
LGNIILPNRRMVVWPTKYWKKSSAKILQGTAKGLTQATLAEKIGISTAFVSRVERGQKKMKVETLYATAKVLNVSVDALLSTESSAAQLANINQLLAGQSDEYLEGIERMIRVCIEEFEPKEKFPSGS